MIWGLDWGEIIAIAALTIPILVQFWLLYRQTIQDKITATLDVHREYNSTEMAKARRGAIGFAAVNEEIDWVNELNLDIYDTPKNQAENLFEIMRYFHRVNVVRKRNRFDNNLLAELIAPELAWWQGFVLSKMRDRPHSRTMPDINDLTSFLEPRLGSIRWQQHYQRGENNLLALTRLL